MGLYQRRRPSPIEIQPTRVRRQDAVESPESPGSSGIPSPESSGLPSPESSGLPSPESSGFPSPDSPRSSQLASPTNSTFFSTSLPAPMQTAAPSQVSSQAATTTTAPQLTADTSPPPQTAAEISPPPPPLSPSSTTQEQAQSSLPAASSSSAAQSSTAKQSSTSSSELTSSAPIALPVLSAPSQDSTSTSLSQSTALPSSIGASSFFPEKPASSPPSQVVSSLPSNSFRSSTTGSAFVPAQSELDGERSGIGRYRNGNHEGPIISKGAEAAAITLSIMGFIALIVGIAFLFKHRRRRRGESSMRHAEDAFSPDNNGSLHAPETAHINYHGPSPSLAHMTKSSTSSTGLFAGAHYERPETVSTTKDSRIGAATRIAPPQRTPNPFADPPRNKAYDQLRGRPRSTTLTDRGSWVQNPFKDPASERFDPFGEMQEKARAERKKYVEVARREAEDRRRREAGQEDVEKGRAGLQVPGRDGRKGSDVTVGGIGVLDRSGDGRWVA